MAQPPFDPMRRPLDGQAAQVMQAHHVSGRLLVVDDDGRLVGAIHVDDLLRAGVI